MGEKSVDKMYFFLNLNCPPEIVFLCLCFQVMMYDQHRISTTL